MKTIQIEELEITKPVVCKTYKEAKNNCPKGFRLPKRWELFKIFEDKKNRKRLSDGKYMFFWSSLIEDGYIRSLYINGYCYLNSSGCGTGRSDDDGRVIYIKEDKK